MSSSQTQCLFFHPVRVSASLCQRWGFWEMLSLNSIIFNFLSITQVSDLQSFWRKSSRIFWNKPLSSPPPDFSHFPASSAPLFQLLSLTPHFSNSITSPSCSNAGMRPKLINLSELISLVSSLSHPAPHP